jgi:ankyrin repeat protein
MDALLARGASLDTKDTSGNTALHWAAKMDRPKAVELLLLRGADVKALNDVGLQPEDLAESEEVKGLLSVRGALRHAAQLRCHPVSDHSPY